MKKNKKSPCIDVCEYSGPKGWCVGCGRTRKESDKWANLKPYHRHSLENELRKRMARMRADGLDKKKR